MAASEGRRQPVVLTTGQLQVALHISLIPVWETGLAVVQQYGTSTECTLLLSRYIAGIAVYYWLKHQDKTEGRVNLFCVFHTVGLQRGLFTETTSGFSLSNTPLPCFF